MNTSKRFSTKWLHVKNQVGNKSIGFRNKKNYDSLRKSHGVRLRKFAKRAKLAKGSKAHRLITIDDPNATFEDTMLSAIREYKQTSKLNGSPFHMEILPMMEEIYAGKDMFIIHIGVNWAEDYKTGYKHNDLVAEFVWNENTRGLLIEALPSKYKLLLENTAVYSNRFKRMNAAVMHPKVKETVEFYMFETSGAHEENGTSRAGSFNESSLQKTLDSEWKLSERDAWKQKSVTNILLPAKDPAEIYTALRRTYPQSNGAPLMFLHVQAEGYDWKIVRPFLEITSPKFVAFQNLYLSPSEKKAALRVLKHKGYASWETSNHFYAVHLGRELLKQF